MGCYVYVYKDAHGTIRYVGKGSGARATEHLSLAVAINEGRRLDRATHFTRWLAKCIRSGSGFSWELVAEGLTDDAAFELEKRLIEEHKRKRDGGTLYNVRSGGDGFSCAEAKAIANRPDVKARKEAGRRAAFADPAVRARFRAATKESNSRPHRVAQQREKALREWANEDRRRAAADKARELWADPDWSSKRRAELVARNKATKQQDATRKPTERKKAER